MNWIVRRTCFLHLTLSLVVGAFLWSSPAAAFEILGQVTDAAGNPYPRARVGLAETRLGYEQGLRWAEGQSLPEPVSTTVTDEHGSYRLPVPEPGLWRVVVSAPGHIPMERGPEAFVGDEQLPPVALVEDAGLTVTVTDEDGAPLPEARVWFGRSDETKELWSHAYAGRWRPLYHPVFADEQGRVRLHRAPGETLNLRAWAPGHVESPMAKSDGRPVRFELSPGFMAVVEVHDFRGTPVEGVLVRVGLNGWSMAVTDEEGRARAAFSVGQASMVRLDAGDGRWGSFTVTPQAFDEGRDTLRFALANARVVHGRVTDLRSGEPVPGALVWFGGDGRFQRTNRRGDFELRFSEADEDLSVRSLAGGYTLARVEAEVEEEGPLELDLVLKPALKIRGQVIDPEGNPLAGASLWWRPKALWSNPWPAFKTNRRTVQSASDGLFLLGPLDAEQTWEVRAELEGFAPGEVEVSSATAARPVEIVLTAGGTLRGRLVGSRGEVVPGARLRLFETFGERARYLDVSSLERYPAELETTTAQDGSFRFRHLPDGRFALGVVATDYAPKLIRGLGISAGREAVDLGDVTLEAGARIEGRVVDETGAPVPAADVILGHGSFGGSRLIEQAARNQAHDVQSTGADGRFYFGDLAPGSEYSLVGKKADRAPAFVHAVRPSSAEDEPVLELVLRPAARVFGEVVDPRGRSLPEVPVQLARNSTRGTGEMQESFGSETTDGEGRFEFDDLPAGDYLVWSPATLFNHPVNPRAVELVEGREVGPVRVVRPETADVEGRVLASTMEPASFAEVHLSIELTEEGSRNSRSTSWTSEADPAGRFRFAEVPLGRVTVSASHPDHGVAEEVVTLSAGSRELELVLRETTRIEIWTLDGATESPVGGANVILESVGSGSSIHTSTGSDGRAVVRPRRPGEYSLRAIADGYRSTLHPDTLLIEEGSREEVRLYLDRGAEITGRVTGLEPAELGRVVVRGHRPGPGGFQESHVDPEGRYRLSGIAPGVWTVRAQIEDPARQADGQVTVEEGQREVVLDLDFKGGYSLTGRVFYNGEPAGGLQIRLASVDGQIQPMYQPTDYRGAFRFGGLEAGRYRLIVEVGSGLRETRNLDLVTDEDVEIDLRGAAVMGRVIDETGNPVPKARVQFISLEAARESLSTAGVSAGTGSDGRFELQALQEGTYRLIAQAASVGSANEVVTVFSPETDLGDVTLERGYEALLAVRGPGDLTGLRFGGLVRDAAGQPLGQIEAQVESDGLARVSGLPAEGREILVGVEGFVPVLVPLDGGQGPYPLPLVPAAQVRVVVPALSQGGGEATMQIVNASGRRPVLIELIPGAENGLPLYEGQGAIPALAPGLWTVTVTAADGRTWARKVEAVSGETVDVVLE